MGLGMLVIDEVALMTSLKILWMCSSFVELSGDLIASTQFVRLSFSAWSSSLWVTRDYQLGSLLLLVLRLLLGLVALGGQRTHGWN